MLSSSPVSLHLEGALKTPLCDEAPSMSSTTDDDDFSSPDSTHQNGIHDTAALSSSLYECPTSLETPVLSSPSPMSPTPANNGLYYRPHRSSHKIAINTSSTSPPQSLPSLSPRVPSPLRHSPSRRRRGRKRFMGFLVLLLMVSMFATLSLSLYLMNQLKENEDKHHARGTFVKETLPTRQEATTPLATIQHDKNGNDNEASPPRYAAPSPSYRPRIAYYSQHHGFIEGQFKKRRLEDDLTLHAPPGLEAAPQDDYDRDAFHDKDCVPMSDWQTLSFPNCNTIHELQLEASRHGGEKKEYEDDLKVLGQGWFRQAWQVDVGATNETMVLKTLRLEREFYSEFYELHRRDAVAMERLTFSPFVMDIYGFCGQSALNEMASFGHGGITSLENFDRRLRGKDSTQATFVKLQIATSVAVGVAHVHQVNGADTIPAMVHYDLNPRNIAIVQGGKPKLNDFNIAEFLRINPKTNETCGFPSRLHEPWWRSPEEVVLPKPNELRLVDEKADVFSLGNILYHILTSHSPRGKMNKRTRLEIVRTAVSEGQPPGLHKMFIHSKDPAIVAFRKAMKLCFVADPKKRASATEVANILLDALMEIREKKPNIMAKH